MAWAFDAANAGVTENDADSQITFTHTTGVITNGMLFVWAAWSTTTTTITSVTYNGVAMNWAIDGSVNRRTALYYLENPTPGANSVQINFSAVAGRICAGSASYSGMAQVQVPNNFFNSGTSLNPSSGAVASALDELVLSVLGVAFVAGDTLTGNGTQRGGISGGATRGNFQEQNGAAPTVTITWTNSNSRAYSASTASFQPYVAPVVTGGGGAVPVRGWDGRHYAGQRGNVQAVYRRRTTDLSSVPITARLSLHAKLELVARPVTLQKPSIETYVEPELEPVSIPIPVKPRPVQTVLSPQPVSAILMLSGNLERVETRQSKRIRELARQIEQAKQEILDLEDQLLLGVN